MTKRPIPTSRFAFGGESRERRTAGGCLKTLLVFALCAAIATAVGWYVPVLLCDVLHLPLAICQGDVQ